ncbi:MAG: ASKHA domain-containing protein [Desulfobacteraceae bacterium]|nr:ASKHA domain-containing protein [Desulfobacteraceae bacterium]
MKVIFKPLKQEAEVEPGTSLLNAAQKAGVSIASECGGMGRCGKCKLVVQKGVSSLSPREREYLTPDEIRQKIRLACRAAVKAPAVVSLLALPSGKEHILEEGVHRSVSFRPFIKKYFLDIRPTDLKKEKPLDKIVEDFLLQQGIKNPVMAFSCLKALPSLIGKDSKGVTALVKDLEVLGFEAGDTSRQIFGLAVDIGTTTVVGYLFDLFQGNLIAVDSALNIQSALGSDVVSRIEYALNTPDGLDRLQNMVADTINHIIENLCSAGGISSGNIYGIVTVGNTSMHHLFLGISPKLLARSPYNPITGRVLWVRANVLKLKVSLMAQVICLPLVSGFIGSDTVGVVLATGLHRSQIPKMAIDIGTNGEIVLTDGKTMIACSCAAGPAFEGAQIQCGMRGVSGAIDRVEFSENSFRYHVIDESPPEGICGSGLVDAVAAMQKAGLVSGDGRLLSKEQAPQTSYSRMLNRGKYKEFVLSAKDRFSGAKEVVITQKDIRELQLAKGAMMAGIRILLNTMGLQEEDVREVYLAGAFGNYLRAESAMAIGLLPVFKNARITQVGNAAGTGAKMALLSTRALNEALRIARRIKYVELAKIPEFQQQFMKGMSLPSWTSDS